jgi:UPF0755 protein
MSYIKKILVVIALLGLVFGGVKVYDIMQIFTGSNTAFNNEEAYVYIPTEIDSDILKDELFPLLKDEETFKIVATKLGYQAKAGKYTLKKEMSNVEMIRALQSESDLVTVIIPDSNEIDLLAQQISNQIEASEIELLTVLVDTVFLIEKELMFPALYKPGNYKMSWNTSAEEFRTYVYKTYTKRK